MSLSITNKETKIKSFVFRYNIILENNPHIQLSVFLTFVWDDNFYLGWFLSIFFHCLFFLFSEPVKRSIELINSSWRYFQLICNWSGWFIQLNNILLLVECNCRLKVSNFAIIMTTIYFTCLPKHMIIFLSVKQVIKAWNWKLIVNNPKRSMLRIVNKLFFVHQDFISIPHSLWPHCGPIFALARFVTFNSPTRESRYNKKQLELGIPIYTLS